MKHIWSPWRIKYFQEHAPGCVLCNVQKDTDGPGNLVVARGRQCYVLLNRYPYTSGHLMVIPFAHKPYLEHLDPQTRAEMMELVTRCMTVLRKVYNPQAFNIGANIGEAAGAGIKEHVHIHIVPRWAGDTNFMSAVGETRVLPESLEQTWQRVQNGFSEG